MKRLCTVVTLVVLLVVLAMPALARGDAPVRPDGWTWDQASGLVATGGWTWDEG